MSIELNTVAPKKWSGNYSGTAPTLDSSNGIYVGDFAIDTSTTPNNIWKCIDSTIGSAIWIRSDSKSNVASITSTHTVRSDDFLLLVNTASSDITVNLPVSSSTSGLIVNIKKIDNSSNSILVNGNGSELIDGELIQYINTQYDCMTIVCDGSGWNII